MIVLYHTNHEKVSGETRNMHEKAKIEHGISHENTFLKVRSVRCK